MRETSEATEIEKLQKLEKWPNLGLRVCVIEYIKENGKA